MVKSDILIAIPARGGSKRLKRKNVILINGKPMIAYTIEAALKSKLSSHVYVCTEDDEIAEIAVKYGAKVHRISLEMAGDEVSSTVPCMDLLKTLKETLNLDFEYLFNLQPTSPLRDENDLLNSIKEIKNEDADYLVSTTMVDPHYCHWVLEKNEKWWSMIFKSKYLKERTQLPAFYRPNGAIKLGKVESLLKNQNYFGEKLSTYMMPEEKSIHVGTEFDLKCVLGILNY